MDSSKSSVTNLDYICRSCFKDSHKHKYVFSNIFDDDGTYKPENPSVSELIEKYSTTQVLYDDPLPKYICLHCYQVIFNAYAFKLKCDATYEYLHKNYSKLDCDIEIKIEHIDDSNETNKCSNLLEDMSCQEEKVNGMFKCPLCSKLFKERYYMVRHLKTHNNEKSYFCKICQKYYKNERHHKWIHKTGKRFNCESCGSLFFNARSLNDHMETHLSTRKMVECEVPECGKQFKTANGLDYHKSTAHCTEKDVFLCQICSKSFKAKWNLKLHMSYHSKEKTHKCRFCEEMFKNHRCRHQHELRVHLNKTPKDLKLECAECKQKFTLKSQLEQHMNKEHSGTQFALFKTKNRNIV